MKVSFAALFAVAAVVSAQTASDFGVPACANDCFLAGISNSTCGLTDFYCQCGAEQQKIQDTTLKCLCTSTCTTNELFQVYSASTKICQQALSAHGETYNAPLPNFASVCNSATGNSATGSASATGGSNSAKATSAGNQAAAVSQTSSGSSAQTSSAGAARGLLAPGAVAAIGGLAMFAF